MIWDMLDTDMPRSSQYTYRGWVRTLRVHNAEAIFDTVGGDTLQSSWQVVRKGGVLVSVVSPRPSCAEAKARDVRPVWFVVEPNREQLIQIGALMDAGRIRPIIEAVLPLPQARQAYEQGAKGHTRGKIVLRVVDEWSARRCAAYVSRNVGRQGCQREDAGKITHRKEMRVMSSLAGKVALVSGGNSGIGLATARAFHNNGAKVVISGRDRETLEEVARQLGPDVLAVQADVTRLSEIDQLMARAHATFGKLDILFVNAGIFKGAPLEEVDEAAFNEMLNANFKGAYFTVQKALPFLNAPASIIFNGSVNALTGITDSSLYTANKGAIHALARALAAELIGRGIRVNTITIGPTATRLLARSGSSPEILQAQDVARISRSPVKRLGRPEEVANVALFLASDDSSFVVGSEIAADGGWLLNTM